MGIETFSPAGDVDGDNLADALLRTSSRAFFLRMLDAFRCLR